MKFVEDYTIFVLFPSPSGCHILTTKTSLIEDESFRQQAIKLIDMYGDSTQVLYVRDDFNYSVCYFKTSLGRLSRQNIDRRPDLFEWISSGELIPVEFA